MNIQYGTGFAVYQCCRLDPTEGIIWSICVVRAGRMAVKAGRIDSLHVSGIVKISGES